MNFLKIAACLWLLSGAALAAIGLLSSPHIANVAVVFGNTVDEDGSPSPRLAARLERARQCYLQRHCEIIFVSGGIEPSGANEAASMHEWLVRKGIPVDRIVVDERGDDTWATARHVSEFMRSRGFSSAMAVTQYFHLPRAMLALKRFGIPQVRGVYPRFWESRDLYSIMREVPASLWYAVRPRK